MSIQDLYLGIVKGQLTLSAAMAIVQIECPLSKEENDWVSKELSGYEGKQDVPDYRQLTCEVKARVQNLYNGAIQDIRLKGKPMENLDSMLKTNYGLSIYKLYVGQGIESIEQQLLGHNNGDIIMKFEGAPGQELIDSLKSQERFYNFTTLFVFQEAPLGYLQNALTTIKNRFLSILKSHMGSPLPIQSIHLYVSEDKVKKEVFISYGWEDEGHKEWVHCLARRLAEHFSVRIDEILPLGGDLNLFMEKMVTRADRVLLILTPTYKQKADNRENGVGYESVIISTELFRNQSTTKFIPIIRKGSVAESYPNYLGNRKGMFMKEESIDEQKLSELINDIRDN